MHRDDIDFHCIILESQTEQQTYNKWIDKYALI